VIGTRPQKGQVHMNRVQYRARNRSHDHKLLGSIDGNIQFLLDAEEQLLLAISTRAPLKEILNGICSALDCQIGSVVSLISLLGNDADDLSIIARKAAVFGLFPFCSESVLAETHEVLGTLKLYCVAFRAARLPAKFN
jgi:hypothetical protein